MTHEGIRGFGLYCKTIKRLFSCIRSFIFWIVHLFQKKIHTMLSNNAQKNWEVKLLCDCKLQLKRQVHLCCIHFWNGFLIIHVVQSCAHIVGQAAWKGWNFCLSPHSHQFFLCIALLPPSLCTQARTFWRLRDTLFCWWLLEKSIYEKNLKIDLLIKRHHLN